MNLSTTGYIRLVGAGYLVLLTYIQWQRLVPRKVEPVV